MTAFARGEIVTAECPLTVVTSGATGRTARRVMIQRQWRRHLAPARQTGPDLVTCSTRQLLRRIVIDVTEANSISSRLLRSANQTSELVAGAAR